MASPASVSSKRIEAGRTPASIAAKLSFDHVTHRYDDVTAVRDLSLDIEPGQIVCLLGRSGCGKTTLLRLAAGVEEPAEGRILINDRAVSEGPNYLPPERRGARYVCALALALPERAGRRDGLATIVRRGTTRGRIADRPRGGNGFGYDPIFEPDSEPPGGRTLGEWTAAEKNGISHRARAAHRMGKVLRELGF